jgi:peptidoglycan/xylan/chitin deacetylase (PgdA/CDA1 family)
METGDPDDVLILCYHAVSAEWPAPLSVTPERFERQLQRLIDQGYTPVTFSAAAQAPPGGRLMAVTFDDAYRSVMELGRPILERLGATATVFVPTAHVATSRPMAWPGIDRWLGGPHADELMPLDWRQLGQLAADGWEIGSHTRTHPRLTTLDDAALREELGASRQECEQRLGIPCTSVAYPYGDVDERVAKAAGDAGYRHGAALSGEHWIRDPLRRPRTGVYHGDDGLRFAAKVWRPLRRARASDRAGPFVDLALRRAKGHLTR